MVDDDPRNLLVLEATLERLGHPLVKATSAEAALQRTLKQDFAVILMDVQMNGMSGVEATGYLRSCERTRSTPVILLTARDAEDEEMLQAYAYGAVDYLRKPYSPRVLCSKVSVFVDLFLAREEVTRQAALLRAQEHESFSSMVAEPARHDPLLGEIGRMLNQSGDRAAMLQGCMQALVVSHDLRAPLRHISGLARLLEERAGAVLDEKSTGYVRTIADAAQRGGQLVDDLLSFSRMGRAELQKTRVDLNQLVGDVRSELALELGERVVQWQVGELPELLGDPALLRLVIRSLLANALEHTRQRSEASVEVAATQQPGEVHVWVKDNGVGFDMQHVDRHSAEELEGTGIGLANVRRIIHRHGGRTWAEGALNQGATFHITLPMPSVAGG
jgi:signal transduction histidine kinase